MDYKIIKVCGMRDVDNMRQVAALPVNWMGMIFYPSSPRFVEMTSSYAGFIPDRAKEDGNFSAEEEGLTHGDDADRLKMVGVFVDDMPQNIVTRVVSYHLDIVQLHGNETPTLIRNLRRTLDPDIRPGIKFMKVISVETADDIAKYKDYEGVADYFLFDTKCPTAGGSGQKFDWQILQQYDGNTPFLLSGGIGLDDIDALKAFSHPKCIGIDLNSRFETSPAVKDVDKIKEFIEKIK